LNGTHPFIPDDDYISNLEVLRKLAEAFSDNTDPNKTQLQNRLGLRQDYAYAYLDWLKRKGHLRSENEGRTTKYRLTPKGKRMFQIASELHAYLKDIKPAIMISVALLLGLTIIWSTPMRFF